MRWFFVEWRCRIHRCRPAALATSSCGGAEINRRHRVEVAETSAFSNDPTGLLLLDVQLAAASGPNSPPTEPPLIPSLNP